MITRKVAYTDFLGNERTEELRFNLTQTEIVEMSMDLPDGVSETVDANQGNDEAAALALVEKLGGKGVFDFVKSLILKAYGVVSEDGRRFEKNEKLTAEFAQTLAFDAILMELMSDDKKAIEFIQGVIPTKMAEAAMARMSGTVKTLPEK